MAKTEPKFSAEERAVMRATAAERRAAQKGADLAAACVAAIAEMPEPDRGLATRVHELVAAHTSLRAKTWYSMPAYTDADGQVVVFFQAAAKFKNRYATLGFQQAAKLDDGTFWPISYALTELTPAVEKQLVALLERAVG